MLTTDLPIQMKKRWNPKYIQEDKIQFDHWTELRVWNERQKFIRALVIRCLEFEWEWSEGSGEGFLFPSVRYAKDAFESTRFGTNNFQFRWTFPGWRLNTVRMNSAVLGAKTLSIRLKTSHAAIPGEEDPRGRRTTSRDIRTCALSFHQHHTVNIEH